MVQRLSSFSVGQTAKVLGLLYGLMGFLTVPFIVLAGIWIPPGRGSGFGIGYALTIPLLYGAMGFVFTAVGCSLYNWVAGMVGGIEIRLDGDGGSA
jgi:hypothetical protein